MCVNQKASSLKMKGLFSVRPAWVNTSECNQENLKKLFYLLTPVLNRIIIYIVLKIIQLKINEIEIAHFKILN